MWAVPPAIQAHRRRDPTSLPCRHAGRCPQSQVVLRWCLVVVPLPPTTVRLDPHRPTTFIHHPPATLTGSDPVDRVCQIHPQIADHHLRDPLDPSGGNHLVDRGPVDPLTSLCPVLAHLSPSDPMGRPRHPWWEDPHLLIIWVPWGLEDPHRDHLHHIINSWGRRVPQILVLMVHRPACILPCHLMDPWVPEAHRAPLMGLLTWARTVLRPSWTEWIQGKISSLKRKTLKITNFKFTNTYVRQFLQFPIFLQAFFASL